ncbi:uncharacterized protein LOC131666401 isoform X1 [Phymastichus coffea]|uniref:uncharacterized protein LOC131666401 isoform X1 n=1 Tax=Phymastichus coffea TaxID=108790 RepID=UPI00273B267E|nr:uncharacterized protein LOC131666401 isoform X1 [Phymastichus coffea]XP_058795027.1 uncharacterized protein LOC131666401 isoform X1 [Phymastichus coffea]XP_058795028.1 uncharacterized protein LOC131666401 isoform X1 [Phymastichus coffea]XP_058795029.1 uncharacterized protein LOC131666401 isoform X1 [Phymastichus coffea]
MTETQYDKTSCQEVSQESNETNIPISLLKEIIEDGKHSTINPQFGSSTCESNVNNLSNTSFILPSEHLQILDSVFSLESHEFFLNNCGSKRLIIGLTSLEIPKLTVTFKLHDLKNNFCVAFNKKDWNKIVQLETIILDNMLNRIEEQVYDSEHISIEILIFYNIPCVKFKDIIDNHCTLALETFQKLMLLKNEIEAIYDNLNDKIKDVTKRMKLFMDITFFLLFKSNNIDNRHNYNREILSLSKSSNFLNLTSSVAEAWKQLGKFISAESNTNSDV